MGAEGDVMSMQVKAQDDFYRYLYQVSVSRSRVENERAHALLDRMDELTTETRGWRGLFRRKARKELIGVVNELADLMEGIEI